MCEELGHALADQEVLMSEEIEELPAESIISPPSLTHIINNQPSLDHQPTITYITVK